MRLRESGALAALILGCACSASAPAVMHAPPHKETATLEARGDVDFVLADAVGHVDSIDSAGKPVTTIAGCEREYFEAEASMLKDARTNSGLTMFTFNHSPVWPLQLRWTGQPTDTVSVVVRCTVNDSTCMATALVASSGGTRLSRLRIERKLGQRGGRCSLRIIRL